jgi:hypothetical protein
VHIVLCTGVSAVMPLIVDLSVDAFSVVCVAASELSSVVKVVVGNSMASAGRAQAMGGVGLMVGTSVESSAMRAREAIGTVMRSGVSVSTLLHHFNSNSCLTIFHCL